MSFPDVSSEKHYSTSDVAKLWRFSLQKVRELFADEPGVLKIGRGDRKNHRRYVSIRIPESVLRRVHAKLIK